MALQPLAPALIDAFFARRCLPVISRPEADGYLLLVGPPSCRQELVRLQPIGPGWRLHYPGGSTGEVSSLPSALRSVLLLLAQRPW